jgi:hypothetical protein
MWSYEIITILKLNSLTKSLIDNSFDWYSFLLFSLYKLHFFLFLKKYIYKWNKIKKKLIIVLVAWFFSLFLCKFKVNCEEHFNMILKWGSLYYIEVPAALSKIPIKSWILEISHYEVCWFHNIWNLLAWNFWTKIFHQVQNFFGPKYFIRPRIVLFFGSEYVVKSTLWLLPQF